MNIEKINFNIHKILTMLPHRYPFLMVDRVIELEPHKSIKALKNVTVNEPFFTGHFPQRPVMPGVMILEALGSSEAIGSSQRIIFGFWTSARPMPTRFFCPPLRRSQRW